MFFSRGLGKDHERRAAQPFLVSNTKCTVRRGVWSTASGVASVPSSSFFAGLVQDPPSPFLHNHDLSTRFIHQPNPILFLPLSYRSSSFPPLSLSPCPLLTHPPLPASRFPCTGQVRSFQVTRNHINVRASASRHRHSPAHVSTRILASWGRESSILLFAHARILPRTRSLARSLALAPLPRPFSSTFHFVAVRPRGTLLNTVNNRRKEPLPVCKPCTVRPWLRFTYRRGDGPMQAAFDHVPREIHRIPDQTRRAEKCYWNIPMG